jgi:gamma-glutamyltranspeptidase/glutathione hydrolase
MASAPWGKVLGGDTVYISCVDGQGNACSFINSVYYNFGSGLVAPGTGIVLQNRGGLFSLDEDHPNALAPGKRPFHTIIPALATQDGELHLCYGVMGGHMQPQGHLQVVCNMVDFGLDPQQAINALRFQVVADGVLLEEGLPAATMQELGRMGHRIHLVAGYQRVGMGGAQVIRREPDTGVLWGGSEPRKDGCAIGW